MNTPVFSTIFPTVKEVPLTKAPLVKVLAQIKFEALLSVQNEPKKVTEFQNKIQKDFPLFVTDSFKVATIDLKMENLRADDGVIYRFADFDQVWKVSLGVDFISMETTKYTSRANFIERFSNVLKSFETVFEPQVITRVGIRYIDHLEVSNISFISKMIKTEALGILTLHEGNSAKVSINETLFKEGGHQLFTRWGLLPPGATTDMQAMAPKKESSWFLDIDASFLEKVLWKGFKYEETLFGLATTCYNQFRWFVTDDFLGHFGGSVK